MNSLLWLIAVFAAAVAFVILGRVDAGYVLFVFPPYRVEVTMLFFAVAARESRIFYETSVSPARVYSSRQ